MVHNARVRVRKELDRVIRAERGRPDRPPGVEELGIYYPFYNRGGARIHRNEFAELYEDAEYRQICLDHHDDVVISTVWLGIDHAFGTSPRPIIFETMIFGGDEHGYQRRYATEDAARCGHIEIMETLLAGARP